MAWSTNLPSVELKAIDSQPAIARPETMDLTGCGTLLYAC